MIPQRSTTLGWVVDDGVPVTVGPGPAEWVQIWDKEDDIADFERQKAEERQECDDEEADESRTSRRRGAEESAEVAPVPVDANENETGIVACHHREYKRPHVEEHDAHPGVVDRGRTALYGEDIVATGLYDVINDHEINRKPKAQQQVHNEPDPFLHVAGTPRPVCIECPSQVPHNAHDAALHTH